MVIRSTSGSTTTRSPNVLFLRHGERKPVAVIKGESFSGIEEVTRQRFNFPPEAQLRFHAKNDDDELVEVDAAVWPHMQKTITSLWIEVEGATPRPTCNCSQSKAQTEPLIRIFVITWMGWTMGVRTNPSATVGTLKALIQSRKEIPPDQQRLRFRGDDMDDDETLESYSVGEDSGVLLLMSNASHDKGHEEEADSDSNL